MPAPKKRTKRKKPKLTTAEILQSQADQTRKQKATKPHSSKQDDQDADEMEGDPSGQGSFKVLALPPKAGFLANSLRAIIDGGPEGEDIRSAIVTESEEEAEEELREVCNRYAMTPYLGELAATHIARVRHALRWRPLFLAALSTSGNETFSCDAATVEWETMDRHRRVDPIFAQQIKAAERRVADLLYGACFKSAVEGDVEAVYNQGCVVGYVKRYDTRLRIEFLRSLMPHKFKAPGNNQVTVNTAPGAGAVNNILVMDAETIAKIQERRKMALEGRAKERLANAVEVKS